MMKRLFFYIVCLLCFFNSAAFAQAPALPADFTGEETLKRLEEVQKGEAEAVDAGEYAAILWEIGEYFYRKYPDDKVFYDKEFINELRPFFPNESDEELYDRLVLLRNVIDVYKAGADVYNEYIKKKLVPHTYKKVHERQDFDDPDEVPYVEPKEGEFVKVYNFKKFLSYAENPDERKAIEDFKKKEGKELSFWEKVQYAADKIEWKKVPFYGESYKNPLLSEKGTGEVLQGKNLQLRLLSPQTYIDGQKELTVGVQILTDEAHFVLANNLSDELQKIKISLDGSENVEAYEVLYPVPFKHRALPAYHKYFGDFLVPIKLTVQDVAKPLKIKADVALTSCNGLEICHNETFAPEMVLEPKGDDIFPNGYENFFATTMAKMPHEETKKLKLEKFVADDDDGVQTLRLEFTTEEKVENFQVYIEEDDGYTAFAAPLVSLADGKIFVRFLPLRPLKYDLTGSEFSISAALNGSYFLRQTRFVQKASAFDTHTPKLNFGLIFLAFLGGLLLNFMPCVFPALSLKIMAISQHLDDISALRRSLKLTVLGIFAGFSVIICALWAAKAAGVSLGWGMQYQNMAFLVIMMFVLTAFLVLAPRVYYHADLPLKLIKNNQTADLLLGALIVLLATPCTGPYLATAVGFALTGSNTDIAAILYAVAAGLSAPYLLLLVLKEPQNLFPKPGVWMNKLAVGLNIMLLLTIGWFLVLIYQQTDMYSVLKIGALWVVFYLICRFYSTFMQFLDERSWEDIPTETEVIVQKKSKYVIIFLALIPLIWGIMIAQKGYVANYERRLKTRQTAIDMPLIEQKLRQGRSVLLEISADWCLTCHYNDALVLTPKNLAYWRDVLHLDVLKTDWTDYNAQTLEYMARYGRKGLPFYILYTPFMREGMVLPEIFDAEDIRHLLMTYE